MSKSSVNIRRASIADAALLAEVGARTFADTFAADNTPEDMAQYLASAFGPALQAAELADSEATFLIAEVGRGGAAAAVAGYAKMRFGGAAPACVSAGRAAEVARLYVEQDYHGRGVGAALMEECFRVARSFGAQVIWLGVWERNWRARAFYGRWGFRDVGSHEFRLGADVQRDLLLECEL